MRHEDTSLGGSTILVVEDDDQARDLVRRLLESLSARVVLAENGRDGLNQIARIRVDAVLCDLSMPVMDGLEFARQVRRDPRYRHLLLFALTGWQGQADFFRTWEAGFDAHLVKPITGEMLQALALRLSHRGVRSEKPGA